jgi:hypothetical protein
MQGESGRGPNAFFREAFGNSRVTGYPSVTTCALAHTPTRAEAVPGAATVSVAAIHTTAEFTPGSIPQPIHVVDTNLNNGALFSARYCIPKIGKCLRASLLHRHEKPVPRAIAAKTCRRLANPCSE